MGKTEKRPASRPWIAFQLTVCLAVIWLAYSLRSEPFGPLDTDGLYPELAALVEEYGGKIRRQPRSAVAYGELGIVYLTNSLPGPAETCLVRAVELDEQDAAWHFLLAVARRDLGQLEEAAAGLRETLRIDPGQASAYQYLGEVLLELGDLEGARGASLSVAELRPDSPAGPVGLGEAALARGQWAEAAEQLEQAVGMDPSYQRAHYLLGLAYRELGRIDEARQELRQGQGGEPHYLPLPHTALLAKVSVNIRAKLDRASALQSLGKLDRARALLEELEAARPDDPVIGIILGGCLMELGELAKAQALFLRHPELAQSQINLSTCYQQLGQPDLALASAREAVRLAPSLGHSHYAEAVALAAKGDTVGARSAVERALARDKQNADAYCLLGKIEAVQGQLRKAQEQLGRALELEPGHLDARISMVIVCRDLRLRDEGLGHLKILREQAPEDRRVQELWSSIGGE